MAPDAAAPWAACPTSGVAHSPQNLAAGRFACPQTGQTTASGVAHSMQNLVPAGFSVPQFEQITPASLDVVSAPKGPA